jgi:hypothetical protein
MPNSFQSEIADLAASFAESILLALRSASLDELLAEARGHRAGPGRPANASKASPPTALGGANAAPRSSGRLPRRSSEEIAEQLKQIVALLRKQKDGLRAEQIRAELGLQAKEMPRILKEGLTTKSLSAKGQKRATTYFAK